MSELTMQKRKWMLFSLSSIMYHLRYSHDCDCNSQMLSYSYSSIYFISACIMCIILLNSFFFYTWLTFWWAVKWPEKKRSPLILSNTWNSLQTNNMLWKRYVVSFQMLSFVWFISFSEIGTYAKFLFLFFSLGYFSFLSLRYFILWVKHVGDSA